MKPSPERTEAPRRAYATLLAAALLELAGCATLAQPFCAPAPGRAPDSGNAAGVVAPAPAAPPSTPPSTPPSPSTDSSPGVPAALASTALTTPATPATPTTSTIPTNPKAERSPGASEAQKVPAPQKARRRVAPVRAVQPPTASVPAAATVPEEAAIGPQPVTTVLGQKVALAGGQDLGRIVDVLVTDEGRTRAAVIDVGGFLGVGNRKVAVDWSLLRFRPGDAKAVVTLNLSRAAVQKAPEFKGSAHPEAVLLVPPAALAAPTAAKTP